MSGSAVGVRLLAAQLGRVPKDLQAQLRPLVTEAGRSTRDDAARRASWSTRIPGALKVRTSFAGKRAGVYIAASAALAPHARPYEGITGGSSFRHPLFGDYDYSWFPQDTRPFLAPAVLARGDRLVADVEDAISHVAIMNGFR